MKTAIDPPAIFDFDRTALAPVPEKLGSFVHTMVAEAKPYSGAEKRCEPRHAVALVVTIVPTNRSGEACGKPFLGLTSNVSASGLALVHTEVIDEPFLAVEFCTPSGHKRRAVLEVLRCRPIDEYFEIGGRFVMPLA